ncbi:MAG: DUF4440 domain-containing protein [Betaproteobacteria bacterium]|jgi:ketosteroid isomerase-like protein|nr:DUF4440 domain-containing protein [Betaproteobacteria bacterium]NBP44381.1 DUF4440 domain-containing protein [Betaproteobacteria bacterium]
MVKSKWKVATLGGSPDEVEAALYEAMQKGNLEQFMACWSDDEDIVCVHPGGPRIVGHEAIRQSFETLFESGAIMAKPESIRQVTSLTSSVHNLVERVRIDTPQGPREAVVLATNVYHRTPQGWRLVLHHASPASEQDLQHGSDAPAILH